MEDIFTGVCLHTECLERRSKIMSVFLIACIVLSYLFWIKCIYRHHPKTLKKSLKHLMTVGAGSETAVSDVRALIVTAHPDDECMFFAPTIIRLLQLKASVHLLCLSEGTFTLWTAPLSTFIFEITHHVKRNPLTTISFTLQSKQNKITKLLWKARWTWYLYSTLNATYYREFLFCFFILIKSCSIGQILVLVSPAKKNQKKKNLTNTL